MKYSIVPDRAGHAVRIDEQLLLKEPVEHTPAQKRQGIVQPNQDKLTYLVVLASILQNKVMKGMIQGTERPQGNLVLWRIQHMFQDGQPRWHQETLLCWQISKESILAVRWDPPVLVMPQIQSGCSIIAMAHFKYVQMVT